MRAGSKLRLVQLFAGALAVGALLAGCARSAPEPSPDALANITDASFGCMRDMTQVDRFYVSNMLGDLDATLAVARSPTGGTYPPGSVVQLVPTEVMVKREPGFNAQTNDWEFFELDVSPLGSSIRVRGHADVVNRFGGNCLECHAKARPEFDMICGVENGCDPIPLTIDMIRALQKTDPRCGLPASMTADETAALRQLMEAMAATEGAGAP